MTPTVDLECIWLHEECKTELSQQIQYLQQAALENSFVSIFKIHKTSVYQIRQFLKTLILSTTTSREAKLDLKYYSTSYYT